MSKKYVKVPVDRFLNLANAKNKLLALEGGGVDNWSGYDDSMDDYDEIEEGDITLPIIEEE
jgi:hypothetical protein